MLAKELLIPVSRSLLDVEHVRWSVEEKLQFLSQALRYLVLLRPDANATVRVVELAAKSTRQELPGDGVQFLGMVRNMGLDGNTPGAPITLTLREALDNANNTWHSEAGSEEVDHYVFNDKTPSVFYVTPPPADGVHTEIEFSVEPAAVETMDDELPLSAVWEEPLQEYVMFKAYSDNATDPNERARAESHLQKFYLAIGEEQKAKLVYSPNNNEQLNG